MRAIALMVVLALPLPALAGSTTAQTMDWRQDGARLSLRSTEGQVDVEAASPESRFGVRRGDRILRIDDMPVRQIDQLASALEHAEKAQVYLLLRRNGRTVSVPVAVAAWKAVLVPPPAPPPPPPPPPR